MNTDPEIEGLNPAKSRWRRRKGYFSDPAAVAQLYSNQLVILRLRVQSQSPLDSSSTVVEISTTDPKIEGLNPARSKC